MFTVITEKGVTDGVRYEDLDLFSVKKRHINMKCPRCHKPYNTKTNYDPTTKQYNAPTTYMHTYTLAQVLGHKDKCRHSTTIAETS